MGDTSHGRRLTELLTAGTRKLNPTCTAYLKSTDMTHRIGSILTLDALSAGTGPRKEAWSELAVGQKRGHWIWFLFPTLAQRAGDMFSMMQMNGAGADLASVGEAASYAAHPELRAHLLTTFRAADAAMAPHEAQAPYRVFDASFGRSADGAWIRGPVDSFKVFCSATLFAGLAHKSGDDELRSAALAVLRHFKGDVIYTAGAKGTSGNLAGDAKSLRNVLKDHDAETLELLGNGVAWADVLREGTAPEKGEL